MSLQSASNRLSAVIVKKSDFVVPKVYANLSKTQDTSTTHGQSCLPYVCYCLQAIVIRSCCDHLYGDQKHN